MFKAINSQNGKEVIILDPLWEEQVDRLRALDKKNILLCQECDQPVRVRAGEKYRWHFAHKRLEDCKYGKESPERLQARAVLYKWLTSKFGDTASIEKKLEGVELPRPIDCWVEEEHHKIAYWVVDSQVKPAVRQQLVRIFAEQKIWINWVFCVDVLKRYQNRDDALLLSTTEREFMRETEYDEGLNYAGFLLGKSLHYLDYERKTLITFRQTTLEHYPQVYVGRRKEHPLQEIKVKRTGGEFWHPSEHEEMQCYSARANVQNGPTEGSGLWQRNGENRQHSKSEPQYSSPGENMSFGNGAITASPVDTASRSRGVGIPTCIFCGKQTKDYWFQDIPGEKCRCRKCLRKGFTKPDETIFNK